MTREEFYSKIDLWISQDKDKWNHLTLVAYFYYKYREKNGVNYISVSWKSNPALTKESRDFSKLFKIFCPEYELLDDPEIKRELRLKVYTKIYNYINWMFDYKFRNSVKNVTGTGFFLNHNILNEFEVMYNKHLMSKKNEDVFQNIKSWIKKNYVELNEKYSIEEKKDLQLIEKYIELYSLPSNSPESQLIKYAYDKGIL